MLGLLYDIHGNFEALETVLDDCHEAGVERFVLGGDYALFGVDPGATVERLRTLDAHWIRGNVDRWTAHVHEAPEDPITREAIEWCRSELGDRVVSDLAGLPEFHLEDGVRFSHASPLSDTQSFAPEASDDDARLLDGHAEPLQIFGHTHVPFERTGPGGLRLVNPGSVGMPLDGDQRASWAILHDDGRVEHRRTSYDYEFVTSGLRKRGEAWAERSARRIEQAQFVT